MRHESMAVGAKPELSQSLSARLALARSTGGGEANGSLAKDAYQLIDQGAHARSALYVGVDNEPDVEPVGRLAGKGPL